MHTVSHDLSVVVSGQKLQWSSWRFNGAYVHSALRLPAAAAAPPDEKLKRGKTKRWAVGWLRSHWPVSSKVRDEVVYDSWN